MRKQIRSIVTNPLFSGSTIMIIGSNSASFVNYLYHLIMGRMLGPANYGELASLISLIGLLGMLPASISYVVIKYVSSAKDDNEVGSLISWLKSNILKASIIFTILILALSPIITAFLKIQNIAYLILIAVSFLFSLQTMLNRSILQGLLRFKEMVLTILVENTTKLIISIFLVYLGYRVGGAIFAYVLASLLGWYVTGYYLKDKIKKKLDKKPPIRSILMFTIPMLIQAISTTSLYSTDIILVKHFFSSHDAGIYASLSTLGKIIFFATGPISAVMFPLVAQRKARGKNFKKIYLYSLLITSLITVGISIMYWWVPQFAIKLLFGSAYLEASNLLVWFGVFMSLVTLSSLIVNYCLSLGRSKVAIFPLVAALTQLLFIILFHQTIFAVISVSIIVTALLLISLLIYSSYNGKLLR